MPTKFVETIRKRPSAFTERERRMRRLFRGIGGVACDAGNAHDLVVDLKEGFECFVVHRPIVCNTVERFDAEVGGMQTREMGAPQNGAAADAVEVDGGYGRIVVVDGVVRGHFSDVGVRAHGAEAMALPVGQRAWVFFLLHASALFQAEDVHSGFIDRPGQRCARCACSDYQNVYRVLRHTNPPLCFSVK